MSSSLAEGDRGMRTLIDTLRKSPIGEVHPAHIRESMAENPNVAATMLRIMKTARELEVILTAIRIEIIQAEAIAASLEKYKTDAQ